MELEYEINQCPICGKYTDDNHELQINEETNQVNIKCHETNNVIVMYNIFEYTVEPKSKINYCPDCGAKICECIEVEDEPDRLIYICPECGVSFNTLINKLDSQEE